MNTEETSPLDDIEATNSSAEAFESADDSADAEYDRAMGLAARTWNSQAGYLDAKFGDKIEAANYGWGTSINETGVSTSTLVHNGGKVYILSSAAEYDAPDEVEHVLTEWDPAE